jgi:hypothetical protein
LKPLQSKPSRQHANGGADKIDAERGTCCRQGDVKVVRETLEQGSEEGRHRPHQNENPRRARKRDGSKEDFGGGSAGG